MAQARPELDMVLELEDAVLGRPPRSATWKQYSSGLAADLANGRSGNWKPLGCAVALLQVDQRSIASPEARRIIGEWVDYYAASRDGFMGGEFGSRIYGAWHMLSNLAVAGWSERMFKDNQGALDWLAVWWHLCRSLRAPDGQILMIGQRSGGHPTTPGWFEYFYARASGEGVQQAEAWGRAAGLGIKKSWTEQVLKALQGTLSRSFARAMAMPAPEFALRRPLTVIRTDAGLAAYLGTDPERGVEWSNDNGNTTPVVGATWQDGQARYLPDNGGIRLRQRFERCRVVEQDGKLIYDSDVNGHQELDIPGTELSRTTFYWRPGPA
jgi:hypothetical protein